MKAATTPTAAMQESYARLLQQIDSGEVPVTFQVGLVASDGIILASDMKATKQAPGRVTARSSSLSEKISILPERNLCYCCSGDNFTAETAKRIVEVFELENERRPDLLRDRIQEILTEEINKFGMNPAYFYGDILLAWRTPSGEFELWQVGICPPAAGTPHRLLDKVIQGDYANTAQFFLEKYYPKVPASATVAQLLPLAAHTVLMAGAMNPVYVGGLEITICTKSELRKLTAEELAPLIETSWKIDSEISSRLGF